MAPPTTSFKIDGIFLVEYHIRLSFLMLSMLFICLLLLICASIQYKSAYELPLLISACGTFSGKSFYIESPNYPLRYPHNEVCRNTIRANYGNRITLTMEHFDLELSENCTKDHLKIYERAISNSTLRSTRCGNNATRYVSESDFIYLVFKSDSAISGTGYRIKYESMSINFYFHAISGVATIF